LSIMAVSESKVRALSYIEQVYWETGTVPTDSKLADVVGVSVDTVRKYYKDDKFREALRRRGVSLDVVDAEDDPVLTIQQLDAANLLLNTYDKRSMREKLEEIGISTQQLNAWMRDPKFSTYIRKRAEAKFASADSTAYMTLLKGMESGDLRATQLFLEMRGIYNPRVQVDVNVDGVLVRVVEIIAKHVKDPAILANIAQDIELLAGGPAQPTYVPELPTQVADIVDAEVVEDSAASIKL
jgi:Helix-turn-helix of insertion element transposase